MLKAIILFTGGKYWPILIRQSLLQNKKIQNNRKSIFFYLPQPLKANLVPINVVH